MGGTKGSAQDAGAQQSSCFGCFCSSMPWLQVVCTALIVAGLVIFSANTGQAFNAIKTLLAELKVNASVQSLTSNTLSGLLGASIGAVLVVLALSVLATGVSASGKARRYRKRHGAKINPNNQCGVNCEMFSTVAVIFLMWIFLAACVAIIAFWTAVFLGAFAGDEGASFAMGTTDKLQQKISSALKKADGIFTSMRSAWDRLMGNVPSFLKNMSWFQDLTNNIGGPILNGSKGLSEVTCAPTCLDMGVFATIMKFEPRCVCGKDMLTSISARLKTAWKGMLVAVISIAVIAIAGSWILMATVSTFVHAKRDRREMKDAAARQAIDAAVADRRLTDDVEAAGTDQMMAR